MNAPPDPLAGGGKRPGGREPAQAGAKYDYIGVYIHKTT